MTQEQLAEISGFSQQYISGLEKGKRNHHRHAFMNWHKPSVSATSKGCDLTDQDKRYLEMAPTRRGHFDRIRHVDDAAYTRIGEERHDVLPVAPPALSDRRVSPASKSCRAFMPA